MQNIICRLKAQLIQAQGNASGYWLYNNFSALKGQLNLEKIVFILYNDVLFPEYQ
jgi:hypothetical protein